MRHGQEKKNQVRNFCRLNCQQNWARLGAIPEANYLEGAGQSGQRLFN